MKGLKFLGASSATASCARTALLMQNSLPVSVKVVPRVLQSSCPGYGLNCTGTAGQFWHRGKLICKRIYFALVQRDAGLWRRSPLLQR